MSTRWTKGEWRAFYKSKYDEWHVSVPSGEGLKIGLFPDGVPTENPEADAKLIAAAPALAEALEDLTERYVDFVGSGGLNCGEWNPEDEVFVIKARAALASAKGEQ